MIDINRLLGLPSYSYEDFTSILSPRQGLYVLDQEILLIAKELGFFWSTNLLSAYCGQGFFEQVIIHSIKLEELSDQEIYNSILDNLEFIEQDCLMQLYLSGNVWPASPEAFMQLPLQEKIKVIGKDLSFYITNRDIHQLFLFYAKRKLDKQNVRFKS